jgi:hypothetical protein
MLKINKHESIDRFEAHMVKKDNFIHDEYYMSPYCGSFHMDASWGYREGSKGFNFGINKKKYRAMSMGFAIDASYAGKTSQL